MHDACADIATFTLSNARCSKHRILVETRLQNAHHSTPRRLHFARSPSSSSSSSLSSPLACSSDNNDRRHCLTSAIDARRRSFLMLTRRARAHTRVCVLVYALGAHQVPSASADRCSERCEATCADSVNIVMRLSLHAAKMRIADRPVFV